MKMMMKLVMSAVCSCRPPFKKLKSMTTGMYHPNPLDNNNNNRQMYPNPDGKIIFIYHHIYHYNLIIDLINYRS